LNAKFVSAVVPRAYGGRGPHWFVVDASVIFPHTLCNGPGALSATLKKQNVDEIQIVVFGRNQFTFKCSTKLLVSPTFFFPLPVTCSPRATQFAITFLLVTWTVSAEQLSR